MQANIMLRYEQLHVIIDQQQQCSIMTRRTSLLNKHSNIIVICSHDKGSGCSAAGFTRCCVFGACRVNLPGGGHCFCDRECFTYPHHNCCSDNPCDGKREFYTLDY